MPGFDGARLPQKKIEVRNEYMHSVIIGALNGLAALSLLIALTFSFGFAATLGYRAAVLVGG